MARRLVVCGGCALHVKVDDARCPHCGVPNRSASAVGRTAGAVLMGLSLAGCPAGDDTSETLGNGESSSSSQGSSSEGSTSDGSTTLPDTNAADPAYGSPATETFGTTDMTESATSSTTAVGDTTSTGGDTDTEGTTGSGSSSSTSG